MARNKGAKTVVEQLRQAIRESGKSLYSISAVSGVDRGRISRFLRGERELTTSAFEKLCEALGLQLTKTATVEKEEE